MKAFLATALVLAVLGSAAALLVAARPSHDPQEAQYKYLVAKMPRDVAEIEFDSLGKGKKLKTTMLTPLDSLGRDGWELVAVVRDDTGSYLCFFKAPK
jgi:gas vesicle protein